MREINEVWRPIKGFEGYYECSSFGNIRSIDRVIVDVYGKPFHKKGRILKSRELNQGYLTVGLSKNNYVKNYLIHRLIAQTFLPNPQNYTEVNHKDENTSNNRVDNLEWCSPKYNANYGTRNKRVAEKQYKSVNQYTLDGVLIKIWESARVACKELGYKSRSNIQNCCKGRYKSAYGFIWKYA